MPLGRLTHGDLADLGIGHEPWCPYGKSQAGSHAGECWCEYDARVVKAEAVFARILARLEAAS